jgi:predicted chitinase
MDYVDRTTFGAAFENISPARADALWPYFNEALQYGSITTCNREAAFIAQIGHESLGLLYFEELASGAAYEGRTDLGNTEPGDGMRFKGRGPIQLTGRANYQSCATSTGVNFVNDPEKACYPSGGFLAASWFWKANNLNQYCDSGTAEDFIALSKRINGGTNGLDDRLARWDKAKKDLGCDNVLGSGIEQDGEEGGIEEHEKEKEWLLIGAGGVGGLVGLVGLAIFMSRSGRSKVVEKKVSSTKKGGGATNLV